MNDECSARPTVVFVEEHVEADMMPVSVEALSVPELDKQVVTRSQHKRGIADIKPVHALKVKKPKHEESQGRSVNPIPQQLATIT